MSAPSPTRREPRTHDGPSSRSLTHVPGLDGLRGVAVLMVVFTHLLFVFDPRRYTEWLVGGFLGVELFFVLSGFLITSLLLGERDRSGRISLRGFYARRALRLLPALVVLLAVHFTYAALTGLDVGVEVRSMLVSLFYVSNWYMAAGHGFAAGLQHLWSLSVEEQFYLVWPVITAALLAWRRAHRAAVGIVGAAIVLLTVRTAIQWKPGTNFLQINGIYTRTDTQAVGLLAGAAAAYVWARYDIRGWVVNILATCSAVVIGVCAWKYDVTSGFYWRGGLTIVCIAGALVVVAVVDGEWVFGVVFRLPPLRAVGRVSYGLYLWHLPVFFEVHRHMGTWSAGTQIATAVAVTTGCTLASWHFVERPFLRRKGRLRHS